MAFNKAKNFLRGKLENADKWIDNTKKKWKQI